MYVCFCKKLNCLSTSIVSPITFFHGKISKHPQKPKYTDSWVKSPEAGYHLWCWVDTGMSSTGPCGRFLVRTEGSGDEKMIPMSPQWQVTTQQNPYLCRFFLSEAWHKSFQDLKKFQLRNCNKLLCLTPGLACQFQCLQQNSYFDCLTHCRRLTGLLSMSLTSMTQKMPLRFWSWVMTWPLLLFDYVFTWLNPAGLFHFEASRSFQKSFTSCHNAFPDWWLQPIIEAPS